MNNFAIYYRTKFRQDINQFFATIPDKSKFHEDLKNKQTFSIQYERLSRDFDHMNFLTKDDKEYFGVALFFTVLTDMVCFSKFHAFYDKFFRLTRYPKFIGNCPGGCHYHYNPGDIFAAMNYSRTKKLGILSPDRLEFYEKFNEAAEPMKIETLDFFTTNLPEISGIEFWKLCLNEFPYTLTNNTKQNEQKN